MATHDDDDALEAAARTAASLLSERADAARVVPDFAAMLSRARELDPNAVSAEAVARAEGLAPVSPLASGDDADDAAALAPFTDALRDRIEAGVTARRDAPIPPAPRPRRRSWLLVTAAAAALVAAAAILILVGPAGMLRGSSGPRGVEANSERTSDAADEVSPVPREEERSAIVMDSRDRVQEPADPATPTPQDTAPAEAQDPALAVVEEAAPSEPRARVKPRRGAPPPPAGDAPVSAPSGPSLEDQAQAMWQRGELAAAEQLYREIIRIAGSSARAELAYGDLFALTRQIRGAEGQAAAWRGYLKAFPDGRFADDARAGLCQRSAPDERAACWAEYLERHPAGAQRRQAEAALSDEAGP